MWNCITILDKSCRQVILLLHQAQVQSGTVSDFVVNVVQAAREQDLDAALDFGVLLANAEFGQGRHGGSADDGVLQHDAIVDVPHVLGRLGRLGALEAKQVENAD